MEKCGTAEQTTDGDLIRCMRFACWTTRATDTHSEYVIHIVFHNSVYAIALQYYVMITLPVFTCVLPT